MRFLLALSAAVVAFAHRLHTASYDAVIANHYDRIDAAAARVKLANEGIAKDQAKLAVLNEGIITKMQGRDQVSKEYAATFEEQKGFIRSLERERVLYT